MIDRDVAVKLIGKADGLYWFDHLENRVAWLTVRAVIDQTVTDDEGERSFCFVDFQGGQRVPLLGLHQTRAEAEMDAALWHQSEMMRHLNGAPTPTPAIPREAPNES